MSGRKVKLEKSRKTMEILLAIAVLEKEGISPSSDEIEKKLQKSNPKSLARYLKQLSDAGYLRRQLKDRGGREIIAKPNTSTQGKKLYYSINPIRILQFFFSTLTPDSKKRLKTDSHPVTPAIKPFLLYVALLPKKQIIYILDKKNPGREILEPMSWRNCGLEDLASLFLAFCYIYKDKNVEYSKSQAAIYQALHKQNRLHENLDILEQHSILRDHKEEYLYPTEIRNAMARYVDSYFNLKYATSFVPDWRIIESSSPKTP